MTCKDCVHYAECKFVEPYHQDVKCNHFKNKADVVSKKAYEQVKWERDTAIEQLKSYGVDFCENADVVKVVRCKDCVHYKDEWCEILKAETPIADGFCCYGERKCNNDGEV